MNFLNDSEWLQLLRVVDAVNGADADHEFRRAVLEELRPLIPYDSAAFFLTDLSKVGDPDVSPFLDPVGINVAEGVLEEFIDSTWATEDAQSVFAYNRTPVFKERDLADPEKLKDSDYYHDYLDDLFVVTCCFTCDKGPLGSMNLNRESSHDDFSDKEIYILKILEPRITARLVNRALVQDETPRADAEFYARFHITPREQDVICCLAQGLTNEQLAAQLFISPGTAKKHVENILRKTNCTNRLSLVLLLNQHHVHLA